MKIKTWVMVSALALTGLTSIPSHAYSSKYECKTVLYDALTKAGTKRLVLCASQGGVSYNFGPVKGNPELDVLIPFSKTLAYNNRYPSLALRNGAYTYEVSDDSILVSHKGKSLANIAMREPRVSKLGFGILEYGIPEAD